MKRVVSTIRSFVGKLKKNKAIKWEIIATLLKWLAYETCHKRHCSYVFILLELQDNVWRTRCTWVSIICVEKELKKCSRTCYKEMVHPKSHCSITLWRCFGNGIKHTKNALLYQPRPISRAIFWVSCFITMHYIVNKVSIIIGQWLVLAKSNESGTFKLKPFNFLWNIKPNLAKPWHHLNHNNLNQIV